MDVNNSDREHILHYRNHFANVYIYKLFVSRCKDNTVTIARVSRESGITVYCTIIVSLVIKGYLKVQNIYTLPLYYFLV